MKFLDTLRHYRRGVIVNDADAQLMEVVKAVRASGKVGEITLKLKVHPSKTGDNEIKLTADCTSKVPKKPIPDAIFYGDANGELHRDDPAQVKMFEDEEQAGVASLDKRRAAGVSGDTLANAMGVV